MNFLVIKGILNGKVGVLEVAKTEEKGRNRSTEDWLPVRAIQNSMIYTYGNLKVTGVKVTPRNIFILDGNSQDNVLISLKNFYNMLDFEFWLVVADRPVDLSIYMSQLQLELNDTQTPAIRKLILQDLDKAQMFINNNIVDTEYYFLFKEKDEDIIQKKIRLLINGLATCGLNAAQASNEDLRVILDNFLNGGKTVEFGTVMPA